MYPCANKKQSAISIQNGWEGKAYTVQQQLWWVQNSTGLSISIWRELQQVDHITKTDNCHPMGDWKARNNGSYMYGSISSIQYGRSQYPATCTQ